MLQAAALHIRCGLREDAAAFFAVKIQIVHPFDPEPFARNRFHRTANGYRRRAGNEHRILHRQRAAQYHREVQPRSRRRGKAAPAPAAAAGLVVCRHKRAVGGALGGKLFGGEIGGDQRLFHHNARQTVAQVQPHALFREHVAFRAQRVAFILHGLDRVPLPLQLAHGLPYRRAGNAHLPRQRLARKRRAAVFFQKRQKALFC